MGLTYVDAMVLGIVQGLTEFLPVSSSGHLVLAKDLLGLSLPGVSLEIMLHLGTALAVAVYLRREIARLVRALARWDTFDPAFRQAWMLALATIPAVLVGVFFSDAIEQRFSSPRFVAVMLLITAAILVFGPRNAHGREEVPGTAGAILVGLAQAIAVLPGISRSGSTVVAGIRSGLSREAAARFGLLLSLPVIFGGAVLDALGLAGLGLEDLPAGPLILGIAVSFAFGLIAIEALIVAARRAALGWFGLYCAAAGGLALILTR